MRNLTWRIAVVAILGSLLGPTAAGAHRSSPARHVGARCPRTLAALSTVRTGGISYPLSELRRIQHAVDRHNRCYLYALNPVTVTRHDLPRYGFDRGRITIVSPPPPHLAPTAHAGEDGLPETDVVVRYRAHMYWIVLNQFLRHGPRGIWSIITITPMN